MGQPRAAGLSLLPDVVLFLLVVLAASILGTSGIAALKLWPRSRQSRPPAAVVSPKATASPVPVTVVTESSVTPRPSRTPTRRPTATLTPPPLVEMVQPVPTATDTSVPTQTASPTETEPPPTPTATPTATPEGTPFVELTPLPTATAQIHVVARDETLHEIAGRYDVDIEILISANPGLRPSVLRIGQELVIPPPGGGEAGMPVDASGLVTHTVRYGETLSEIAMLYGTTLNEIYDLNPDVSPRLLITGQVLRIRLGAPTATPTPTPLPTATPLPYPAPALLFPTEGQEFQGPDAQVLLEWTSVGVLAEDEWYVVRIVQAGTETLEWTKAPSWRLPPRMRPRTSDPPTFEWDVTVRRRGSESEPGEPVSPPSVTRTFTWR